MFDIVALVVRLVDLYHVIIKYTNHIDLKCGGETCPVAY